jgi:hypothetical protein
MNNEEVRRFSFWWVQYLGVSEIGLDGQDEEQQFGIGMGCTLPI